MAKAAIERTDPLEIRIKAGTRDGQRIRIAGKGNAGLRGGGVGDLYVIIRIDEHPLFRREGDDIYITVPVTAVEAALGIEDRSADDRWAKHVEDSSGNAVGAEAAAARKGRAFGDQGRRARG